MRKRRDKRELSEQFEEEDKEHRHLPLLVVQLPQGTEFPTRFAAREVATEDYCSSQSNSENREGIDGAISAYRGKTRFSMEGFEDVGAVVGEAIPGPGPCSIYTRRISWVSEDELQKEDHLGKQPFVPKAILHWYLE